jgi:hypothetical protein
LPSNGRQALPSRHFGGTFFVEVIGTILPSL